LQTEFRPESAPLFILVAVLSSYFAASKMVRKRGAPFWTPTVLACFVAYCILIPNLPTVEWIYLAQILSGLSTGILFSYCTSEAMKNIPKEKSSTAMGFFQSIYALGMTTFPILTGAVAGAFHIRSAFYSLAGISLAGLAGAVIYYQFHRKISHANEQRG
jgi:MFS family permease